MCKYFLANLRKLTVLRVDENRITSVPENIGKYVETIKKLFIFKFIVKIQ